MDSKLKFTPGPWKVDKVIKPRYDSDTGERLKDDLTVFIYPDNPKKENFNLAVVNSYCVAEHEANAHLIAAAPEMLEALEETRHTLEAVLEIISQDEAREIRARIALNAEVIAKAEGRGE